jgi:hypothetical protein
MLERIFSTFKEGGPAGDTYDPSDPDSYEPYIQALIRDSRDYEGSVLAAARNQSQLYYYGYLPSLNPDGTPYSDTMIIQDPNATYEQILGHDKETANKSAYVSTDVRDAVMLMLPSLIRLFASSENVVSLIPRTQADVDNAQQQTNYINYVFWQDNPGFLILYGAFKDAMTVRTGFVKWWTDDIKEKKRKTFINLNPQQLSMIAQGDPTAKLIEHEDPDPNTGLFPRVVLEFEVDKPIIKVAGVPPEEMRLDRFARSFSTSRIVGHERVVPIDELVAMGYPREQCLDYLQGQAINEFTMEAQLRNPGRYSGTRMGDGVLYGEWYIKVDGDGDGIAELRYICTMGDDYEIVHDESANRVKFAVFGVDPISHTIVGDSIADYTKDIQKIKTNMTRAVLDSAAESLNPKTVVNELNTDLDDVLNDDVGAVIRTRGNPNDAVAFNNVPFLGQQMFPLFELMNEIFQRRTGLSDAAKGLDAKALQSSSQIGVEAIINGAQERTELVARVLAETGFKDLFVGLYNEVCEAPNQRRSLRINGKWSDVDTGTFDASMGVEVNSTLGKGSDTVRMMTLNQIKQDQMTIFSQFGPNNPVVGIPEMLNTISDMLDIANIKNVGRYFKTPTPQQLQAIATAPKEPDAMTLAAQAQFQKVKADTAKAVGQQQLAQMKVQQDDDFRNRQLGEKTANDRAKIQLEADKLHVSHVENLGRMAADMFGSQMDASAQHHQALQDAAVGHHQAFADAAVGHHQANADLQSAQAQAGADVQSAQIQADAQPAEGS